jgi:hypothetical protein
MRFFMEQLQIFDFRLDDDRLNAGISFHRPFSAVRRESPSTSRKVFFHPWNQIYFCFIKFKHQYNMKATIITIAAILALQMNVLFAGNGNSYGTPVTNENSSNILTSLAPTTPVEANFEDDALLTDYAALAPVTPAEATFDDVSSEMTSFADLAPVTPAVADFEDNIDAIALNLTSLAPTTPAEADFD